MVKNPPKAAFAKVIKLQWAALCGFRGWKRFDKLEVGTWHFREVWLTPLGLGPEADVNVYESVMAMAERAAQSNLAKGTEAGFQGGVVGTPIIGRGQVDWTRSAIARFYAGTATGVRFESPVGDGVCQVYNRLYKGGLRSDGQAIETLDKVGGDLLVVRFAPDTSSYG